MNGKFNKERREITARFITEDDSEFDLFFEDEECPLDDYVQGDDLIDLRDYVGMLRDELWNLETSTGGKNVTFQTYLRNGIEMSEERDADICYAKALMNHQNAEMHGDDSDMAMFRLEADAIRSQLPQFQLGGYWIADYSEEKLSLINITYVGDTLMATKLTGGEHFTSEQTTFKVNLSPYADDGSMYIPSQLLPPFVLEEKKAKLWGSKRFIRYVGSGLVSQKEPEWVDGVLMMFGGNYFSFGWTPIGQNLFFSRPPEFLWKTSFETNYGEWPQYSQTVSRESCSATAEIAAMRDDLLQRTIDVGDESTIVVA
eukprot:CAMPEP_0194374052 /NCGR_PEP_ID=MMETSP0174-20130528/22411_1 /TAXON_ID=216777 /ORGANISM="Proboscia alata, Strain PI-D3" /LENGTH=313 /DNA_ID=CAMNT_0039153379 /DNA_START=235 /DNA_END=1176 /DNA_ORIENTATION=-